MSQAGYQILDEPQPSKLSHLAVQPLWPLLAVMFGGTWISWPWFAVNAFAIGSPTRVRELILAIGGFFGTFVLVFGLVQLNQSGMVDGVTMRYLFVLLLVWKLTVSYGLYILQARTFALYRHFGGVIRTGLIVVIAAGFLRARMLGDLPAILQILLS